MASIEETRMAYLRESGDTPQAMQIRASLCHESAMAAQELLDTMRTLVDQDGPLPVLKMALRAERERLLDRSETLNRRRAGMMAE